MRLLYSLTRGETCDCGSDSLKHRKSAYNSQRSIARRVLDMSRGPRSCRSCWPVLLFATLLVGALAGCGGAPKPTYFPGYPIGFVERGVASWYGPGFHGNKTANGERYDMHQLTAAHRTLPLGSIAVVRSMSTGRQVTVRINDRGPFAFAIGNLSHRSVAKQVVELFVGHIKKLGGVFNSRCIVRHMIELSVWGGGI